MTETEGRRWLKKLMKGCPILLKPIETSTEPGVFDIWFGLKLYDEMGISGWIELKQLDMIDGAMVRPKWRPRQLEFASDVVSVGVSAYLFLFDNYLLDEDWRNSRLTIFCGDAIRKEYTPHEFGTLNCFCESPLYKIKPEWLLAVLGTRHQSNH